MKKYNYYLFDADGTIIDTAELIWKCFENTARIIGNVPIEKATVMGHIGLTLRDQMSVYFGKIPDTTFEEYRKIHMDYQLKIYKEYLRLYDGVSETLSMLKTAGKKCAVVTSRFRHSVDLYLRDLGINSYFDAIITPESTEHHKPHAEPALKALQMIEGNTSEAIFIGDATFDIECGTNAGIDTAFVEWSMNDRTSLRVQPTYYLKTMADLCATI